MTEGILIEIAQRRRKLEDAIEALHPDTVMVAAEELFEDEQSPKSYLEECAEACRDDMNNLMDEVRKAIPCA